MPAGRYVAMDGDGNALGTEEFRCAPGPMGWRSFSEVHIADPDPHDEIVDLAVDADWRPARTRIATGSHELLLTRDGDRLRGYRDGEALELDFGPEMHVDYRSPVYNAVTARRLGERSAEIEVAFLEPVTLEPRIERQRYTFLGPEHVDTAAGTFAAERWRFTALSSGWTRDLWVAGDVVVRYADLYELEWYEPGSTGVAPIG